MLWHGGHPAQARAESLSGVQAAYKLDSTCAEVEEMLAVCVYMGGGPALMYVGEAVKAWEAMVPAAG